MLAILEDTGQSVGECGVDPGHGLSARHSHLLDTGQPAGDVGLTWVMVFMISIPTSWRQVTVCWVFMGLTWVTAVLLAIPTF
jgi:hypothetical protein